MRPASIDLRSACQRPGQPHRLRPCATTASRGSAEEVAAPPPAAASAKKGEEGGRRKGKPAPQQKGFGPREKRYRTCREAIQVGLEVFEGGQPREAIGVFQEALDLPGNGFVRRADSPREVRCPSEKEEQAALYNMACCYARLGETEPMLTCIGGALELGFENYEGLLADPDFAGVKAEVEGYLRKHRFRKSLPFGLGDRELPFGLGKQN